MELLLQQLLVGQNGWKDKMLKKDVKRFAIQNKLPRMHSKLCVQMGYSPRYLIGFKDTEELPSHFTKHLELLSRTTEDVRKLRVRTTSTKLIIKDEETKTSIKLPYDESITYIANILAIYAGAYAVSDYESDFFEKGLDRVELVKICKQ